MNQSGTDHAASPENADARDQPGHRSCEEGKSAQLNSPQLQPVVLPQVSHFRQVPLRTMVKFMHSGQASPS